VPDPPVTALSLERTLDGTLGFEIVEATEERARGRFSVEDRVRQPMGLVHGGVYAAMAESLTSATTYMAVVGDGMIAVGQSNHTSFLRPVFDGTVQAEATRRHRGRTTWIWDVEFTDAEGRLCALSRITLAVRPAPGSRAP
jgi:1,4-dihydroxy-2-naphthoyl-CoA hydrolase